MAIEFVWEGQERLWDTKAARSSQMVEKSPTESGDSHSGTMSDAAEKLFSCLFIISRDLSCDDGYVWSNLENSRVFLRPQRLVRRACSNLDLNSETAYQMKRLTYSNINKNKNKKDSHMLMKIRIHNPNFRLTKDGAFSTIKWVLTGAENATYVNKLKQDVCKICKSNLSSLIIPQIRAINYLQNN